MKYIKNEGECFITGPKHWDRDETTRPTASCFHLGQVFGTRDEARSPSFGSSYCEFLHVTCLLKLINYSRSQKPINDDHFGQMDKSWHLTKHQIKYTTRFLSEIKHVVHLRSNTCILTEMFYQVLLINTTHGNNAVPEKICHCIISYCLIWDYFIMSGS